MESAYGLATKELMEIQNGNRMQMEYRHSQVRLKAPELIKIESELLELGTALLRCILERTHNYEDIKEKIQACQKRKNQLLIDNGFSEDYLDEIHTCKVCNDTGYVEGRRCNCLKQLVLKYISENANLTDLMKKQTFENFDFSLFSQPEENGCSPLIVMKKLCSICLNFANEFNIKHGNLLILGNAGTGKTYLSSCIANRALERGRTVYYQTAYRLFEMLEQVKFNKGDFDDAKDISKYIYEVDLLIIDDLGTEFITQFTTSTFFDIVNSRIISGKSTIISSNLPLVDLQKVYSHRITSRLAGDYIQLQTIGQDLRLRKFNKRDA